MEEQVSKTKPPEEEEEPLKILQKIEDMMVYAHPILARWSIAEKYALGNDMMHCMNLMLEHATAIRWRFFKKTDLTNLDVENKQLQSYIRIAFKLRYLKGISTYKEWDRRSKEIGCMIGGYKNAITAAEKEAEEKKTATCKTAKQAQRPAKNYYNR